MCVTNVLHMRTHLYAYVTNCYVRVQLYAYDVTYMTTLMCYVCVQLYAYVTCGQVSVKHSYDISKTYTYVTRTCSLHEVKVIVSGLL